MATRMSNLNGKTILITGGTGSFGSTILQRLLEEDVAEIRVFSRDELKQENMRIKLRSEKVNFLIGDVRDYESINHATRGVDYIFHAAALKQVPSCEFYPMQAIKTNILGAENLLECAVKNGVKKTVVLSTDKAVYPINTMGMSKAIMEKLAVSKARDQRIIENSGVICATRYGNVMCSRGSIIPLLIKQIKSGNELTITDPNMTRFMMSLKDSVDLVLYAFENAKSGDILVQKSPAANLMTLAAALKELFDSDSDIKIIGARHSEKLYESLCGSEEMAKAIDLGGYYRIPADLRDLNYTKYVGSGGSALNCQEYSSHNTYQLNLQEMKALLLEQEYIQQQLVEN